MKADGKTIAEAWQVASKDLGIQIKAPFFLQEADRHKVEFVALIENFGSDKGMLLLADSTDSDAMKLAQTQGYGYSCLSKNYETFSRAYFIETLDDWGWTGPKSSTPEWYTGKSWSS